MSPVLTKFSKWSLLKHALSWKLSSTKFLFHHEKSTANCKYSKQFLFLWEPRCLKFNIYSHFRNFCHLVKTTNFQNRKSKHGLLNHFFVTVFRVKFRKHVKYPASSKRILNLFIWKKWVYSKTSKFVDWAKKFEKVSEISKF